MAACVYRVGLVKNGLSTRVRTLGRVSRGTTLEKKTGGKSTTLLHLLSLHLQASQVLVVPKNPDYLQT